MYYFSNDFILQQGKNRKCDYNLDETKYLYCKGRLKNTISNTSFQAYLTMLIYN